MRIGHLLGCLVVLTAWVASTLEAQAANVCVDAQGRKTITDKPCPPVEPPAPPPKPRPTLACELSTEQIRRASRLETQFLTRVPDEAAHRRAEAADVQPVVERTQVTQTRRDELVAQRKPLDKELEFYKGGKPVPSWLKSKIDANDAHLAAVDEILKNREQELVEIKARFQCQRDTFGKMWAGAAPGSSACNRPACAPP